MIVKITYELRRLYKSVLSFALILGDFFSFFTWQRIFPKRLFSF